MEASSSFSLEQSPLKEILAGLLELGFTVDDLREAEDKDISDMVPSLLSGLEAFRLKVALRKDRKDRLAKKEEEMLQDQAQHIYRQFLPFLGRIEGTYQNGHTNQGNCVLVGTKGHTLTAAHVISREAAVATNSVAVDSSIQREISTSIEVQFPNFRKKGMLKFKAKIVMICEKDDLALLCPSSLTASLVKVKGIPPFLPYHPQVNDFLVHISFPGCKGEERFSHTSGDDADLPWYGRGIVTCCNMKAGEAFGDYTSFGGSSGSLIIHPVKSSDFRFAIHLGAYHETEEIEKWHRSSLQNLNEGLFEKAVNGYFTISASSFLEKYFAPPPPTYKKRLHPQVLYVKRRKETQASDKLYNPCPMLSATKDEQEAEVMEDLWSPWPGLDDVEVDADYRVFSSTATSSRRIQTPESSA